MKKLLLLAVLVCLVIPVAVFAGSPQEEVVGYFDYTPTGCLDESWANDNYFGRDCHDTGIYGPLGDFVGTSTEEYSITLHGADAVPPGPYFTPFRLGWYKGIVEFTGKVGDSDEGTMWIQYIGKSPGSIFVWSGTWRILGGEDGLEGIHGGGTWWSCDPSVGYIVCLEGKIH